jgi:hypothetical protein
MRIDPGDTYQVTWWPVSDERRGALMDPNVPPYEAFWDDLLYSLMNFAYFTPGRFTATAVVHVWYDEPPRAAADRDCAKVADLQKTFVISSTRDIELEASPWVLVTGAAIGGILGYLVQTIRGIHGPSGQNRFLRSGGWFIVGASGAALLAGLTTILLTRLSTAQSPVAVKVQDLWGAVAVGCVIQLIGHELLSKIVPGSSREPDAHVGQPQPALEATTPNETPGGVSDTQPSDAPRSEVFRETLS